MWCKGTWTLSFAYPLNRIWFLEPTFNSWSFLQDLHWTRRLMWDYSCGVKIRGFFSTYPDLAFAFRICLSQILNLPLHMRIIRSEDPNGNTMSHKSSFFVESSVIWEGIYVFFFATARDSAAKHPSYYRALKCIDPTSCFLRGLCSFQFSFPTLLDRKEVGKIRKQQRKTHPSKVRGRLNIYVWGYLKFCCWSSVHSMSLSCPQWKSITYASTLPHAWEYT